MENDIKAILTGLRHIAQQIEKITAVEWQSQSKDLDQLHEALCGAQGSMPALVTDSSGYTGKFASLPAIIAHIQMPLFKNGLCFTQEITECSGKTYIITTLRHMSGQWTRSKTPVYMPSRNEIPDKKDFNQECGKAISYMRRYALESILGIKADRDDYDGK